MVRNERGSTLLLVLFMMVIFMMLGMAVLGASLSGSQRSEVRENDVQSLHLAEKSLNEAVAYLYAEFDDPDASFTPEEIQSIISKFSEKMNTKIASNSGGIKNNSELNTNGRKSESFGRITGFLHPESIGNSSYQLTIEAEAVVNGVKRTLSQKITLDTFPDFLKYAAGSEGEVILNGAASIRGQLYAGSKLKIKNEADYHYNSVGTQYFSTEYPELKGEAIVQGTQGNEEVYYCDRIQCDTQDDTNYKQVVQTEDPANPNYNNYLKILSIPKANVSVKDQKKFVPININESFIDKITEAVGNTDIRAHFKKVFNDGAGMQALIDELILDPNFKTITGPQLPEDSSNTLEMQDYSSKMEDINEKFKNLDKSTIYEGDMNLDGVNLKQLLFTEEAKNYRKHFPDENKITDPYKSKWLIINGDLIITNPIEKPKDQIAIEIRGNILVTGEIYIKSKVAVDATIMSLKPQPDINGDAEGRLSTTTIVDAQIRGLDDKQLLLISKGAILINRYDAFVNTAEYIPEPSNSTEDQRVLKAYFYTDESATLYGVGSTFWIKGGFFAKKDLTINAALGQTVEPLTDGGQITSTNPNDRTLPRLVIDYDQNIFQDQNVGLPRVNRVSLTIDKKKLK